MPFVGVMGLIVSCSHAVVSQAHREPVKHS